MSAIDIRTEHLAQAERHIALSERHVHEQKERIARYCARGGLARSAQIAAIAHRVRGQASQLLVEIAAKQT